MTRRGRSQAGPEVWRIGHGRRPDGPHVAVIPGADAPLLLLELPEKLQGMARERVAQRMLADRLAMPLDGLEIRLFAPKGGSATRALVADAAQLETWRGKLSGNCLALLPDYAVLPCAPGVWTIETRVDAVSARLGPEDGFTADPEMAQVLLQAAAKTTPPDAVLLIGEAEGLIDGLEAPAFSDAAALVKAGHAKPMRFADAVRGLDLIDPPSAVFDRLRGRIAAWRWPVIVAVLALAAFLGNLWVETDALRQAATTDRQSAREMVRQYFVPSGPILDIRAQVGAALEGAEARGEDGTAEPDVDPLLQFQAAAPFFDSGDIEVETVGFGRGTGLVIGVRAVDFQSLDLLVTDLRGGAFLVEMLESASRSGGGVTGRMRLQQAGG